MELSAALKLVTRLIETGEKHQDYERVVQLERDYEIYKTGEGIGKKLIQFSVREDVALWEQRLRMTKSITPAVTSSIEKPFNKVSRNDRIRRSIKLSSDAKVPIVEKMQQRFYGSALKKSRGLDNWLKTRFLELTFIDPNSWTVIEWDAPESPTAPVFPRPFEVSATEAENFYIENTETKWLWVRQCIMYKSYESAVPPPTTTLGLPTTVQKVNDILQTIINKEGSRFTLYDEEYTIVCLQIDQKLFNQEGGVIDETYQSIQEIKGNHFIVSVYEPKIGYVPAFRTGYKRDLLTKGRTFVNPWHDAMCYLEKTLKTVSEMDLTMALHVFPQKLQYVRKCTGVSKIKRCNEGYTNDGGVCAACNGNGYKLHTSAQDAILLPMPENPVAADIINLDNLLVYKAPPIETVKFQNEYIMQLERQMHQAVYNSQVFIKKSVSSTSSGGGGGDVVQTATENDNNMQSVYDTIEPFTEKYSEMYCDITITCAIIAGEDVEKIEVIHVFPSDFKLKTSDVLLSERKAASDSGAPPFLMETIDDDLATIIYAGDPLSLQKYRIKRKYFPFSGKSPDEINLAIASPYVADDVKVLYMNFENIFKDIERENPDFYVMNNPKKRDEIFDKMLAQYVEELEAAKPKFNVDEFRSAAPDGNEGGENPADGNENSEDDTLNPEEEE